ncbi:acyl-coenzyme A thioesterase 1-like [Protopterus annectens]|uniref:acyl-coenzyme A thioesterase 1-like n=1 Tax=Protopterus annectens TaxID=7888 RepID=UPI001CFB957F|nr:acyl-coenzyme A thioesterase 1-like [Protopterus annectens]
MYASGSMIFRSYNNSFLSSLSNRTFANLAAMSVSVRVFPSARSLFDEPVQILVNGLLPKQHVTLKATLVDESGEPFESSALYQAEKNGELDLSRSPALDGSFSGIEPMGLFWSLASKTPYKRMAKRNVETPYIIGIEVHEGASVSGQLLAKCTTERWFMKEGIMRMPVREGRIRGTLFLPPGAGPFPGIIDLYGSVGGLLEHRACLLANYGFATLALAYFDFEDLPPGLENLDLEYFEEAAQFLQKHPKVKNDGVGVIGISKGADLALSMASWLPGIKAAVITSGFNANFYSTLHYKGLIIPPLRFRMDRIKHIEPQVIYFKDAMDDPRDPKNQDAIIPVEKVQGQLLFLAGEDDRNIPSVMYMEEAVKRLQKFGKKNFEYYSYPKTGHLIEPPYFPLCLASWHKPMGVAVLWGGEAKSHMLAQENVWSKIRAFLWKHLGGEGAVNSKL